MKNGTDLECVTYVPTDNFSRFVIPKKIRNAMGIKTNDAVKLIFKDGVLTVEQAFETCFICGESKKSGADINEFNGKKICSKCLKELSKLNK